MKEKTDSAKTPPAYLRLYRRLRDEIVAGAYPFGGRLPSKRTCAEENGLSLITVEHAYALLVDEGYLEARERSGYYVCFRASDWFAAAKEQPPRPLPVTSGERTATAFPFTVLARTMRRVISDCGAALLEKPPGAGCDALRDAVRRYLARSRGMQVQTEQIIIGSGSESLYRLIVDLLGQGRIYAVESPSYQKILQVYQTLGVTCEELPLGRDGIESAALWASEASVLHLSPYRSFPTGVTASASKRHEYRKWAAADGRYLIEDDFESEFSVSRKPEETLFSHAPDDVIYLNTFSKTVSPALRTAYMVLPPALVEPFAQKLGFASCTVPTFEQLVLAQLLETGEFERHINRVRRARRRELRQG